MTKNSREIVETALMQMGALEPGGTASADDYATAKGILEGTLAEFKAARSLTLTWDVETVPDEVAQALSDAITEPMAAIYPGGRIVPQSRAFTRMLAVLRPDDRGLQADYDEDGTVTDDEQDAFDRAAYY